MFRTSACVLACAAMPAAADVPAVVADIGPVHSMVARVMDGVGSPTLLLPTSVSPHGHAMRPSEAAALAEADLVIWVGEALAPWLGRAVESLAEDSVSLELLEVARMADPEDSESGHASDEHHAHGENDHSDQDDHGHDHGGIDPHAWLDPSVGKQWLDAIAAELGRLDPDNAIIYSANAEAGKAELDSLAMEIRARLEPVRGQGYITFHDAYHGFETRFDMPSLGAISVSDAVPPSAGQIAALREIVVSSEAVCVFAEPQFDPGLVETLTDGTEARSGVLDPLGATLQPGTALYPTLLLNLATAFEDCLAAS